MIVVTQDALAVPLDEQALFTDGAILVSFEEEAVSDPVSDPAPGLPISTPGPSVMLGAALRMRQRGKRSFESPLQPEDVFRRARTLAASVGVAIGDGDEAERLAATIGLLLERKTPRKK